MEICIIRELQLAEIESVSGGSHDCPDHPWLLQSQDVGGHGECTGRDFFNFQDNGNGTVTWTALSAGWYDRDGNGQPNEVFESANPAAEIVDFGDTSTDGTELVGGSLEAFAADFDTFRPFVGNAYY